MSACICCGENRQFTHPFHSIVYGGIRRVAYVDICVECFQKHKDRIEFHSRQHHDAVVADAQDWIDKFMREQGEGEEWKGGVK